jgi:hypothetical protein
MSDESEEFVGGAG